MGLLFKGSRKSNGIEGRDLTLAPSMPLTSDVLASPRIATSF